jgi:hypothetical protein
MEQSLTHFSQSPESHGHRKNDARRDDPIKEPLERPRPRLQSAPDRSVCSAVAVMLLDDTLFGLSVLAAHEVPRSRKRPVERVSEQAPQHRLNGERDERVRGHVS